MSGLWHELRRRNVIKVGIAYLIAAWVVAQIVAVVQEPLHLPPWFDSAVIVVLIIGFPFALIVAWAFERTPEGVKRTSNPEAEPAPEPAAAANPLPALAADASEASVAVLPFVNMSSDAEQEYFSDGISEELLNQLAKVKGLHVAGRTSSFMFKGRHEDLRVIGQKLSVANLLEGSVRKSGSRVRVTAQLIKAADGYHLWSESYDRELDDIFAIQDEIAHAVTNALSVTLGVGELGVSTRNVEAYDAYLAGLAGYNKSGRENFLQAIEALENATSLDPEFVEAWALLATAAYYTSAGWASERESEYLVLFERAAERAGAIAPDTPNALRAVGLLEADRRHWSRAGSLFQSSVESTTAGAPVLGDYAAFLELVGRFRDAIEVVRQWIRVEPLHFHPMSLLAILYEHAGELDLAAQTFHRAGRLVGDLHSFAGPQVTLALTRRDRAAIEAGLARLLNGRSPTPGHDELATAMRDCLDDADAAVRHIRRFHEDPQFCNSLMYSVLAVWASYFGEPGLALEFFTDMEAWATSMMFTMWRPLHREMRRLPGFKDLVREMGLVDYWRETGHWGDRVRPLGKDDFEIVG